MRQQPAWRPAVTGIAAAAAGLGTAELAAALAKQPPLVDAVARLVVDTGPRPLVDLTVKLLGRADKPTIRAGVLTGVAALGALAGQAATRSARSGNLLAGTATLAGVAAALRRPPRRPARALLAGAAGTLAATASMRVRRPGILATAAIAGLAALVGARAVNRAEHAAHDRQRDRLTLRPPSPKAPPVDQAETWTGVSPLITPTADFYVTDVNVGAPLVDPTGWRLRVRGMIERPLDLSLPDLADLGLVEFDAVMVCIHNPVGGDRVGNARWLGVPLGRLLALTRPSRRATTLITRAVDGFTISVPLHPPSDDTPASYVVVGMNGRPLTPAHGFPARVFTPGIYGQYTGVKWLTDLVVTPEPQPDYWTPRGWPQAPVPIRPMARIDTPTDGDRSSSPVTVAGVAWAPTAGIERVEVSLDGHPWQPADLAAELAPSAWRRWRLIADLDPGTHRIQARAVSHTGDVQDATPRPPFPTGASGLHTTDVHVETQTHDQPGTTPAGMAGR
jgi:DMSO/TMAO reductase YedYZ molybdopterin-dependent catalytic subunit